MYLKNKYKKNLKINKFSFNLRTYLALNNLLKMLDGFFTSYINIRESGSLFWPSYPRVINTLLEIRLQSRISKNKNSTNDQIMDE